MKTRVLRFLALALMWAQMLAGLTYSVIQHQVVNQFLTR
jgi:hypothetical protein